MKTLKALVFAFCLPFLLVACGTFSNKVAQMGSTQYITEIVDTDKLIALGQVKSDGRFVMLGDKYLYIINSKDLNAWLSENKDNLGEFHLFPNLIGITLNHQDEHKGSTMVIICRNSTNGCGFDNRNVEVELYKRTNDIPIAYQFKSGTKIEIEKGHYKTPTSKEKTLSNILIPFAAVADILLLQLDPNVTGYNPPK